MHPAPVLCQVPRRSLAPAISSDSPSQLRVFIASRLVPSQLPASHFSTALSMSTHTSHRTKAVPDNEDTPNTPPDSDAGVSLATPDTPVTPDVQAALSTNTSPCADAVQNEDGTPTHAPKPDAVVSLGSAPSKEATTDTPVAPDAQAASSTGNTATYDPGEAFGMDLGTTLCCVGLMNNQGETEIMIDKYDSRTFASKVTVENDKCLVGTQKGTRSPHAIEITDAKRYIGLDAKDGSLRTNLEKRHSVFQVDDDGEPYVEVGEEKFTAREVSALYIRKAMSMVHATTGRLPTKAVVAVPAYFSCTQIRATLDAARIAGIESATTITEPTAILISYTYHLQRGGGFEPGLYATFDIGGGTFDCSVVNVCLSDNGKRLAYTVAVMKGDADLGGQDFTQVLVDICEPKFKQIPGVAKEWNQKWYEALRTACEMAKQDNSTMIRVALFQHTIEFPRSEYQTALRKYLRKVQQLIRNTINEVGGKEELNGVIIAGGASYQPEFREIVTNTVEGVEIMSSLRPPAEVVAEGAAIMAGPNPPKVVEVMGRDVGMGVQNPKTGKRDIMLVMIKACQQIPASRTVLVRTCHPKETVFGLFDGPHGCTLFNNYLGDYLTPTEKGVLWASKLHVSETYEMTLRVWPAPDPKKTDPKKTDPKKTDPKKTDSNEPDSNEPDSNEPDSNEPDSNEPDSNEPAPVYKLNRGKSTLTDEQIDDMKAVAQRRFPFEKPSAGLSEAPSELSALDTLGLGAPDVSSRAAKRKASEPIDRRLTLRRRGNQ